MNFFNTQVNDTLFIIKTIVIDGVQKRFFVAQEVTKTTRTQITLENGERYKMETRRAVGKNCEFLTLGMFYSKGAFYAEVTDQTAEYNAARFNNPSCRTF